MEEGKGGVSTKQILLWCACSAVVMEPSGPKITSTNSDPQEAKEGGGEDTGGSRDPKEKQGEGMVGSPELVGYDDRPRRKEEEPAAWTRAPALESTIRVPVLAWTESVGVKEHVAKLKGLTYPERHYIKLGEAMGDRWFHGISPFRLPTVMRDHYRATREIQNGLL